MPKNTSVAAWVVAALSVVAAVPAPAGAAGAPSVLGAWSTSMPGQGGTAHATESFNADGSYLAVRQEPNGTVLRMWGHYRSTVISATQVQLEHELQGWLPRQICAQAPGFAVKCNTFTPPAAPPVTLTFTSPSSFTVNGLHLQRDASPTLLQLAVDERLVLAAPAPVRPQIAQPVMPRLHPYVTPHDPSAGPARDDLQQQRICAVNNGQTIREQNGRLRCVN